MGTSNLKTLKMPQFEFLKQAINISREKFDILNQINQIAGDFDFSKCDDIEEHTKSFYEMYGY